MPAPKAERDGWKELKWGSAPTADMKCVRAKPESDVVCEPPASSGDRAAGMLTLDRVEYNYIADRLTSFALVATTKEHADALKAALVQQYGAGEGNADFLRWDGDYVLLIYRKVKDGPWVAEYMSKSTVKAADAARKEAAKKAASGAQGL